MTKVRTWNDQESATHWHRRSRWNERDLVANPQPYNAKTNRAAAALTGCGVRLRLSSSQARIRTREKVTAAVPAILKSRSVVELLKVENQEQQQERFHQTQRGRLNAQTQYRREVETRFNVSWELNQSQLAVATAGDGLFPLITNLTDWSASEVLQAYKLTSLQATADHRKAILTIEDGLLRGTGVLEKCDKDRRLICGVLFGLDGSITTGARTSPLDGRDGSRQRAAVPRGPYLFAADDTSSLGCV